MSKTFYKIESEWDIGEEDLYDTYAGAVKGLENNPNIHELLEGEGFNGIEEMFATGLLRIAEVRVK